MAIPNKYITESEAVATYAYEDLANGTGYEIYYGCNSKADTTNSYALVTSSSVASNDKVTASLVVADTTWTKYHDIDFDLSAFKQQRIINGKMLVNVPLAISDLNADDTRGYVIVKVRKWDGSTETEIANVQSETLLADDTNENTTKQLLVALSITNQGFQIGETLRITVEGWAKKDADVSNDGQIHIGHDPQNRTYGPVSIAGNSFTMTETQLSVHVPFKIDL